VRIKNITESSNIVENASAEASNSELSLLNDLNFSKPNSTETRDKVRAFLRKKFGKFSL
jgi:uncharacterized protein YukJ